MILILTVCICWLHRTYILSADNTIIHTSLVVYERLFTICILCIYRQSINFNKLHCSLICKKTSSVVWEFLLAYLIWLHLFVSKRTKILRIIIRISYSVLVLCTDVLLSFLDLYNEFQIVSFSFLCFACLNRSFYINTIKLLLNDPFACVVT